MSEIFETDDRHDVRLLARPVGERLQAFNEAGVLTAGDLRIADRLALLAGDPPDGDAVLALALCVRAVRTGSVCLDLRTVVALDPDLAWPERAAWGSAIDRSGLVGAGIVHRSGDLVHLDRYLREEQQIADDLRARRDEPAPAVDESLLAAGLDRLFGDSGDREQRLAAEHAVRRRTTVLTGGPGTGKTTTVAAVLALLEHQAGADGVRQRIALAAPTGKAAARLTEAVAGASARFGADDRAAVERATRGEPALTLHRLLGRDRSSETRFRHHRGHRLPHDVVVVDEASMMSLSLTARLLEALRPQARLLIVGDPDQLASVEAGAVLADLVAGYRAHGDDSPVVTLRTTHRFGGRIGELAAALRGESETTAADRVLEVLRGEAPGTPGDDRAEVAYLETPPGAGTAELERHLRDDLLGHARALVAAASEGRVAEALRLLDEHRLLCAHREGPAGVRTWNLIVERWLAETDGAVRPGGTYAGRPLLVSRNSPDLGLANGDVGIVVRDAATGLLRACFAVGGGVREIAVGRLGEVETMHAMTIHKAQGSQAREITVLVPDADSRLLTRELLYTAVTRAERRVRVVGSDDAVRAAVERRVQRASGLAQRL